MYQRHWRTVLARRSAQAESTASTKGLRMVRRTFDEYYARDCGAGDACCCGGCLSGLWGDSIRGYEKSNGLLCFVTEAAR